MKAEQALSFSEKQEMKTLRERISLGMPAVLLAESAALPLPEELREEELESGELDEPAE